jgi:hypothetical protein
MRTSALPSGLSLKAYFVGCALQGRIAMMDPDCGYNPEKIINFAYEVGSEMYERYIEENPPEDPVSKFNKRVGL